MRNFIYLDECVGEQVSKSKTALAAVDAALITCIGNDATNPNVRQVFFSDGSNEGGVIETSLTVPEILDRIELALSE